MPYSRATPAGSRSMRNRNCGLTSSRSTALLNAEIEISFLPARAVEGHQIGQVRVGDGTPIGPARQIGKYSPRAAGFFGAAGRPAGEDPATAGRIPGAGGNEWSANDDPVDGDLRALAAHSGQQGGFGQRFVALEEGDANQSRARLDGKTERREPIGSDKRNANIVDGDSPVAGRPIGCRSIPLPRGIRHRRESGCGSPVRHACRPVVLQRARPAGVRPTSGEC